MKVKRAAALLSLMPKNLKLGSLTKEEALNLWYFISADFRFALTKQMLKHHLAEECGVFAQQLNAVMRGTIIAEALVWESSESKSTNMTLQQVRALLSGISNESRDWLLDFCHSMNAEEAEFVWRWAVKERWSFVENRMRKWALTQLGIKSSGHSTERLIQALYDDDDIEDITQIDSQCRLTKWPDVSQETPDCWWLIKNPKSLRILMPSEQGYIARTRQGEVDPEVTDWAKNIESGSIRWSWVDEDTLLRLDTSDKGSAYSWGEAVSVLQLYPHAILLIYHEERFYLLASGSVELFAQALRVRRIGDIHYEVTIGFLDGDVVEEKDTLVIGPLPYELVQYFKRNQITYNYGREWNDITGCLVVSCTLTWRAGESKGWYLKFKEVKPMKGLHDLDHITDYDIMIGDVNE